MDRPRLTVVVFDSLLALRDAATAGKNQDEVRNFERANEWLTLMSSYRRNPRKKQSGKPRKKAR
jgi:hypothetical protein